MEKLSQAFILAAGRGERMRPLTDKIPKPLAKIGELSLLERAINQISQKENIKKIFVNSFYLSGQIEDCLKNLGNPKVVHSKENEKLETGGGILNALNLIDQSRPLLVINSDIFWKDSNFIDELATDFDEENDDIVLGLKESDDFFGYNGDGDFSLKENGEIYKTSKKIQPFTFSGIQIIHPRIFKFAPNLKSFSLNYFYIQSLLNKKIKMRGFVVAQKLFHIGDVETLKKVQKIPL